ncbi:LPS export ABC transporter periplasmic protein LptC [bacterium]|nr:LPS export ABC transporter periplasmic protein LptC [bacterium]
MPVRMVMTAILLLAALGVGGCRDASEPESPEPGPKGPVLEQTFFDQNMIETTGGVRSWILKSELMHKYSGIDDVTLVTVTMDFYREGKPFSTLTADSGRANPHTHAVHVWGDVHLENIEGRSLETEELFYDNETELITNEVFDRFVWESGVATGIGMEATPDLEYFEIKTDFASEVEDAPAEEGTAKR